MKNGGLIFICFMVLMSITVFSAPDPSFAIKGGDAEKLKKVLETVSPNSPIPNDKILNTPLLLAAQFGDLKVIKVIIDSGADVNLGNKNEFTPLMAACKNGFLEVAEMLIDAGANVNAKDKYGNTALMNAASNGTQEIITYLISKKADVNTGNKNGITALMVATETGDIDKTMVIIKSRANVNARDKEGKTALMTASEQGNLAMVKMLVDMGAETGIKDNSGKTAYDFSVAAEKNEVSIFIIRQDEEKRMRAEELKVIRERENKEAFLREYAKKIFEAIKTDSTKEIIQAADTKASLNIKDDDGRYAVVAAIEDEKYESAKALIEMGADIAVKDSADEYLLLSLIKNGNVELAKMVLKKGTKLNVKDKMGNNALMVAADRGYKDLVEIILEKEAIDISEENLDGKTASEQAKDKMYFEIVAIIKKAPVAKKNVTNDNKKEIQKNKKRK